jgi:hypothetical protein
MDKFDKALLEFMANANKQIEQILIEKLSLIGVYKEDITNPLLKPSLKLVKAIIYETPTEVREQYSAKGITLFTVIWKTSECTVLQTNIDETTMDRG